MRAKYICLTILFLPFIVYASIFSSDSIVHPDIHFFFPNFINSKSKSSQNFLLLWHEFIKKGGYQSLDDWFECGVDVLSTSAINRGVPPLDISMIMGE